METFALHSKRVLIDEQFVEASLVIRDGQIEAIVPGPLQAYAFPVLDEGHAVIMPGLMDCHVHINEPGRTDWEGFDTATKAAAAGGITTLIDMPLNSTPVTTDVAALAQKIAASEGKRHVHCGFWGGLVPGNQAQLEALIQGGVFGIKAFLVHSGIDDFPAVSESDLRQAMPILKKYQAPLLVHAEMASPHPGQASLTLHPRSYQAYLASRPKSWEDEAIAMMIRLCREFETPIHIVHLSSSTSIAPLRKAQAEGLPITVETCPHYLFFHAEEIKDGQTAFKCAPPIRERLNQVQLWQALAEGLFSFIVTDHSPSIPELKARDSGDFKQAWGGIASLQLSLPAFWTKASATGLSLFDLSRLMSSQVAQFLGLDSSKGKIAPGYDADLVVWDPEAHFEVQADQLHFKHTLTPYLGHSLQGVVQQTYVGGHKVFDSGSFDTLSMGSLLRKKEGTD